MHLQLPDTVQRFLFLFGIWEPSITAFVRSRMRPSDTFIDVGANVGYYSLLAASLAPMGKVVAIEASPSIARRLLKNVVLNELQDRITVHNIAAADAEGKIGIHLNDDSNQGGSSVVPLVAKLRGQRLEAIVQALPLHRITGASTLGGARIVKVDVEGAEMMVFQGVRHLLRDLPDTLEWIVELDPTPSPLHRVSTADLYHLLRESGYRIYTVPNVYSYEFYLRPTTAEMVELAEPPVVRVDVVATKRETATKVQFIAEAK